MARARTVTDPSGAPPLPGVDPFVPWAEDGPAHLVLLQDEPLASFWQVAPAALQAVRRAWEEGTVVSLVTPLARQDYADLKPAAAALHASPGGLAEVRGRLAAEQLVVLVEQASRLGVPAPAPPLGTRIPVDYGLDPDQLRAVQAGSGPARVLAPAGSGKTRVLVSRVVDLQRRGVPPSSILTLAFNRRAAEEMAARLRGEGVPVARRLPDHGVAVRTFHSLGNEIVQRELGWRYAEDGGAAAARVALQAFQRHAGLEPGTYRRAEAAEFVRGQVCRAKTELLPTAEVRLPFAGRTVPFAALFASFLELQREARLYEYDDMVYLALLVLLRNAARRRELQNHFAHVLVDEFQDLNPAQLLVADILALPEGNLFVVGDDDQTIYTWRGARVEHLLDFEAHHPGARTFVLSTNYRSGEEVVRLAQNLIRCNRRRVPKGIRPAPGAPGGRVDLLAGASLGEQAQQAVAWIRARRGDQGCSWDQFAVLARYHAYHFPLALVLDAQGIPHTPLAAGDLCAQEPVRAVRAYLSLLLWPEQATPEECRLVARVPERLLPRRVTEGLTDLASLEALARRGDLGEWHRAQAHSLLAGLQGARRRVARPSGPAAGAVAAVVEDLGVRAHYRQRQRPERPLDEARDEVVLDVLVGLAEECGSAASLRERLEVAPAWSPAPGTEAGRAQGRPGTDCVLLATIHATKGEGFRNVVLFNLRAGAEDGEADAEDERRVLYVGLTRAAEAAAVTVPRGLHSPFVPEMMLDPSLAASGLRRLRRRAARLVGSPRGPAW
ncbi:MAG: ATP-dependent helicase, partial [Candidatus Latescibacterota bacterium]